MKKLKKLTLGDFSILSHLEMKNTIGGSSGYQSSCSASCAGASGSISIGEAVSVDCDGTCSALDGFGVMCNDQVLRCPTTCPSCGQQLCSCMGFNA